MILSLLNEWKQKKHRIYPRVFIRTDMNLVRIVPFKRAKKWDVVIVGSRRNMLSVCSEFDLDDLVSKYENIEEVFGLEAEKYIQKMKNNKKL